MDMLSSLCGCIAWVLPTETSRVKPKKRCCQAATIPVTLAWMALYGFHGPDLHSSSHNIDTPVPTKDSPYRDRKHPIGSYAKTHGEAMGNLVRNRSVSLLASASFYMSAKKRFLDSWMSLY